MNAFIRLLYALLIAGAVVTFAGFAIYSFYQPPKSPKYPNVDYSSYSYNDTQYKRQQKAYDRALHKYDLDTKNYYKNVTYILLPSAVVSAGVGLYLIRKRSEVIGEGLALGGIAVSIYAIVTASLADARVLRFVAVTVLLVIVLLVAHFRFVSPKGHKPQKPVYPNG